MYTHAYTQIGTHTHTHREREREREIRLVRTHVHVHVQCMLHVHTRVHTCTCNSLSCKIVSSSTMRLRSGEETTQGTVTDHQKMATVMLHYLACEKPLRFCHFAANSSTLRSYLCDCGGGNPILGQSRLKWVCTLRFLAFCWLACFSSAPPFTLSFASRVATTPIAVSSRLGLVVKLSKILSNTHFEIAAAVEV